MAPQPQESAVSRPVPAITRLTRNVFRSLLGLALAAVAITVFGTFVAGTHKERQAQQAEFDSWVSWRAQHCRFEGRLENGSFICDNGQRYPARWVRGKEHAEAPAGLNR